MNDTNPFFNENPFCPPLNINYDISDGFTGRMFCNGYGCVSGVTPLIKYIFFTKKYPEIHKKIEIVIKNDPNTVNKQVSNGMTALMYAVKFYKVFTTQKVIKLLLDNGANVSLKTYADGHNYKEWTVSDIINKFGIKGNNNCILNLFEKSCQKIQETLDVKTLLESLPNLQSFENLLKKYRSKIDFKQIAVFDYIINKYYWSFSGETDHLSSCKVDKMQLISNSFKLLIEYGADVNQKGLYKKDENILENIINQVDEKHCDLVILLLDYGFKYNNMTKLYSWIFYSLKTSYSSNMILNYMKKSFNNDDYNYIDDNGNTILHNFIEWYNNTKLWDTSSHLGTLQYLMEKTSLATKIKKNNIGLNMFHLYLTKGHSKLQIERYITIELANTATENDETPLYLAIANGKTAAFQTIYQYDKNINHKSKNGKSGIMCQHSFEIFKFFIDSYKDLNLDNYADTYLEKNNNYQKQDLLFIDFFLQNKLINKDNENLIKICGNMAKYCVFKYFEGFEILCKYNILPDKIINNSYRKDEYEHILKLFISVNGSNYKITSMIISQGHILTDKKEIYDLITGYIDTYITQIRLPLTYYNFMDDDPNKNTSLDEKYKILSLLINSHEKYLDINYQDDNGWTLPMKCSQCINILHKYFIILIYKILKDYNINIKTNDNETLLTLLLRYNLCNHHDLIKNIVENKADVNHVTDTQMTPCMLAIEYQKDVLLVKYLVENGASLDQENYLGYTPLMQAYKNNLLDIIEYLEKLNSPVNTDNSFLIVKKSKYKVRYRSKYVFAGILPLANALKLNPNNANNICTKILNTSFKINSSENIEYIYEGLDQKIKDYLSIISKDDMVVKIRQYANY